MMTRPQCESGPVPVTQGANSLTLNHAPLMQSLSKRAFTQLSLATAAATLLPNAHALPQRTLAFPRDHGAHPDFRTEWWYITGHAKTPAGQNSAGREFGFQVTFFRSRVEATQNMQSQFAAKQLIFAHCAVTDVQGKKLWHDQRIAREGFGIAQASEQDTDVKLRDWTLKRAIPQLKGNLAALDAEVAYEARIAAKDFALDLRFAETQTLLLQGNQGLSRKGPDEKQASYYYSKPHLAATGRIALQGQNFDIQGTAWLDHEWSQELLHPEAVGWDWIGMNLFDGSALTAFQLRRKDGSALWTGGSYRPPPASGLPTFIAHPGEVKFQALKPWTSPTTGAKYPTEWLVRTPADYYTVRAVIPNQELDSRNSTGAVYWEGLSDLFDSNGKHVGRGYLEMTGYAGALRM
jgi:predicted secreted hydrolase